MSVRGRDLSMRGKNGDLSMWVCLGIIGLTLLAAMLVDCHLKGKQSSKSKNVRTEAYELGVDDGYEKCCRDICTEWGDRAAYDEAGRCFCVKGS